MSVGIQVEKTEGLSRKLKVSYAAADCKKDYADKLKELSKTINLKGFRPGKVPIKAIKRQFGSGILQELLEKKISDELKSYFEGNNIPLVHINPIDFEVIAKEHDMEEDLNIETDFEVFPEVKLVSFKDSPLKSPVITITEADIKETLARMQQMYVQWEDVTRAAKKKDQLVIDYTGLLDGKEFEGGSAKDHTIVIGDNTFIPGFEDALAGLKKGESKDIALKFPKDYSAKDLSGKDVVFKVAIKSVKQPNVPVLDDEFAKKLDLKDIATLNKEVKSNLELQVKNKVLGLKKDRVIDLVISKMPLDVPKYALVQEIEHVKRQMYARFNLPEEQLKMLIDQQETPDDLRQEAVKRIQSTLIFAQMAKEYKISPSKEDLDSAIIEMSHMYENPMKAQQELMGDQQALSNIYQLALEKDIVDYIYNEAKVEDEKMDFKKLLSS